MRTLKIINAQGTSKGSGRTVGFLQGGGLATFSTSTSSSTAAARAAAAPLKRYNGVILMAIGVIVAGFGVYIGYWLVKYESGTAALNAALAVVIAVGLVVIISGVVIATRNSRFNRNVYPDAYARWTNSWQCQRCGNVFVL